MKNYWYPKYADELIQTIHDCDVDWRYQGIIRNDGLNLSIEIDDENEALEECEKCNAEIDGWIMQS